MTSLYDRKALIEDLAERASDGIDMKDLVAFYYDSQVEWLDDLSDADLVQHAYDYQLFDTKEDEKGYVYE